MHNAEIEALKVELKSLESRIPIDALFSIGGNVFKSKAEVQLFLEKEMPSNLYYLCHDPITLLENLSGLHVEKKDVLNELFQADRVGMSAAEARHCAAFQITLPTIFGYVKDGASTKFHLPAVKSCKEWNPNDGVSGVQGYIVAGLHDLSLQVRQEIEDSFDVHQVKAKSLARDMHDFSQSFLSALMDFVNSFYTELCVNSKSTPEEAWELVSALIKKVFEVLRKVRTGASSANRDRNPITKCTSFLWAMIQSHKVMREIQEARFRNHVMLAPVIILHVFKTRVTRVAHEETIKRLEG